ncbi:MAG: glycosyltransferase family 1 protein [Chloroflexi bacterium]|nr:glycosyltransferase family 1 protein [Chloroflexota bacterium]
MLKVIAHANAQTYYLSHFYTGLWELAHAGKIQLKFVYPWSLRGRVSQLGEPPMNEVLWMVVEDTDSGAVRKVCYDHHDKSYLFADKALELCDVYFKRSYVQADVDKLAPALAQKVVRMGFDFPCRSAHDRSAIQRSMAFYFAHKFDVRQLRQSAKTFYTTAWYLRENFRSPTIEDFEDSPTSEAEPKILYQTRVYSPGENTDTTNVNEWRVSIIRALKKEFGDRFVGGLQVNEFSKTNYPDCLTTRQADRWSFISMVKSNLIAVETRGLHYSTSWKMGEYMAAARCIVSEPPRHELPVPLEDGVHVMKFTTPDECVAACARVLDDPTLAAKLRHNAHQYYLDDVRPAVRVAKRLASLFNRAAV